MDFANRGNRPMQQQQQQQQPAPMMSSDNSSNSVPVPPAPEKEKRFGSKRSIDFGRMSSVFVLFGVALLVAVLIVGLVFGSDGTTKELSETDQIKSDKYQAVFLNSQDGQVYFGKLRVYNSDMYVLEDIYYVRVENPVQPEGTNQI